MDEDQIMALFKDKRVVHCLQYHVAYSPADGSCLGAVIGDKDPKERAKHVIMTLLSSEMLPYLPQILALVRWDVFDVRQEPAPDHFEIDRDGTPKVYRGGKIQIITGYAIEVTHYTRHWESGFSEELFEHRDVLEPLRDAILEAAHKTGRNPKNIPIVCTADDVDGRVWIDVPAWIILELAQ